MSCSTATAAGRRSIVTRLPESWSRSRARIACWRAGSRLREFEIEPAHRHSGGRWSPPTPDSSSPGLLRRKRARGWSDPARSPVAAATDRRRRRVDITTGLRQSRVGCAARHRPSRRRVGSASDGHRDRRRPRGAFCGDGARRCRLPTRRRACGNLRRGDPRCGPPRGHRTRREWRLRRGRVGRHDVGERAAPRRARLRRAGARTELHGRLCARGPPSVPTQRESRGRYGHRALAERRARRRRRAVGRVDGPAVSRHRVDGQLRRRHARRAAHGRRPRGRDRRRRALPRRLARRRLPACLCVGARLRGRMHGGRDGRRSQHPGEGCGGLSHRLARRRSSRLGCDIARQA